MPNLVLVSVFDCFCDLSGVSRSSLGWKRTLTYQLGQSLALDVFHREEVLAFMLPDFVSLHDPGVLKAAHSLCLGTKSLDIRPGAKPIAQNGLHRDDTIETDLAGAIYDPHTSTADFVQ
jgi:hypothetical protein